MPQGIIASFDAEQNTGRIQPADGDEAVAFDGDAVEDRRAGEVLAPGERVTYEVEDAEGSPKATKIHRPDERGYGG